MNLENGLIYLYASYTEDNTINNPFALYSELQDICKGTFEIKEEIKLYFKVIKEFNLFTTLLGNGIEYGTKILKKEYKRG